MTAGAEYDRGGPTGPPHPSIPDDVVELRRLLERAGAALRKATAARDELVVRAVLGAGISQRDVARTVGLSHTAVQQIVRRAQEPL